MKEKAKIRLIRIPAYLLLAITSVLALVPFYIMFIMGTYKNEDIFKGLRLLPGNYLAQNIQTILQGDVFTPYLNSMFISIVSMVSCILVSALCGYGMSKFRFKGRTVFLRILMITLMMPYQISLAGYLMEMRWLHLNNTLWPMILCFSPTPSGRSG